MILLHLSEAGQANAWLEVFGRFHIVLLHLPIGLIPGMFVLEFGAALLKKPAPRGAVLTLAVLTTITTALAFASGWVLAEEPRTAGKNALVATHKNFAIAFAVTCVLLPFAAALARRGIFRGLLAAALGLSVATGHFGGAAVHKSDFLWQPLTRSKQKNKAVQPADEPRANGDSATAKTTPNAAAAASPPSYAGDIAPLFKRYCTDCHNPDDYEGDLDLTSREGILTLDRDEVDRVLVPGKPEDSLMIELCELPIDDEDHMPPEDEDQPSKADIDLLRRWIAAGCPFE